MMVSLIGCASMSRNMVNDKGHVMYCKSAGFGWLGTPIAIFEQFRCERNLAKQGYKEVGN